MTFQQRMLDALSRERYAEGYAYCAARQQIAIEELRAACAINACSADGIDDARRWLKGVSKEKAQLVVDTCPLLQDNKRPAPRETNTVE